MTRMLTKDYQGRASFRHQRGVNLIEVMVSMVIGLFLVLGATSLYVNSKKSADTDESLARLQETARYAMSVLETDIRMSNYWGMQKDDTNVKNGPNQATYAQLVSLLAGTGANDCGVNYVIDTFHPIVATNNGYTGFPTTTCAAKYGAVTTADTLTVRRAARERNKTGANGNKVQLCSSRGGTNVIKNGSELCLGGEIHDLVNHIYYVAQGSDQSTLVPSLRRRSLGTGPGFIDEEIIPGIEDMQIQFGWAVDNASGSTANAVEYLQPDNPVLAAPGGQIVAVRVWLLVRAETADSTYSDSNTYEYGDRASANGTSNTLNTTAAANSAYAPADHFRRLLVSRTFFIRNVLAT